MTPDEQKYIRIFSRYLDGPVRQALQDDKHTSHIPVQVAAAMGRLCAASQCADAHAADLQASARDLLEGLAGVQSGNEELGLLNERLRAVLADTRQDTAELNAILVDAAALLARLECPENSTLYSDLVQRDIGRLGELEMTYNSLTEAPPLKSANAAASALTGEQVARLLDALRAEFDEADDLEICDATAVVGGYSKLTVLAKLSRNRVLPQEIVIRLDRPESPTATSVTAEFPLLKALHDGGTKVPEPLYLDSDGRVMGAPLMIVTREAGRVIADPHKFHDNKPNEALAASLAVELAKLHTISLDNVPAAVPGRELSNRDLALADLKDLREEWQNTGSHSIVVEAAFRWLIDHVNQVGDQKRLLHGDARFHNILVSDGVVSSILDWELSSLGPPASDLGYAYHHVTLLAPWDRFLAAYKAAGGPEVPETAVKFFALRTELFAVVKLTKLEAGFKSGFFENIDLIYAGTHVRQHNMYLLARRLEAIVRGEPL